MDKIGEGDEISNMKFNINEKFNNSSYTKIKSPNAEWGGSWLGKIWEKHIGVGDQNLNKKTGV